jgi:hypothetical protein
MDYLPPSRTCPLNCMVSKPLFYVQPGEGPGLMLGLGLGFEYKGSKRLRG